MIVKLKLSLTEEEAEADFKQQIVNARKNLYRRFDNWVHILRHEKDDDKKKKK